MSKTEDVLWMLGEGILVMKNVQEVLLEAVLEASVSPTENRPCLSQEVPLATSPQPWKREKGESSSPGHHP